MKPRDTHPDAHRIQLARYREMSPERRGEMAALLSDDMRSITRQGIRLRHPEFSDEEVSQALVALLYGPRAAR